MDEVNDLAQARRVIAQLRKENHQIQSQLTEAQDVTTRWKINYFDMQKRVKELDVALAKQKAG